MKPPDISHQVQTKRPLQADGRVHGVVVACRRADGKWLCIRRSDKVASPLRVCFPGGTIEAQESQTAAIVREMKEELDARVRPIARVWQWDKPDWPLTLWGWTAELLSGELHPDPAEVAEILWLSGAEVSDHPDGLPSNRLFVASLDQAISQEAATKRAED
jgi:8-oxo-dGTP diphosphatase